MKLDLDIGKLVIEDAALLPGRAERIAPLVEAEVERRLRRKPPTGEPAGRERVEARPLGVVPATDEELARELADRVVESLQGGSA
jgi:hypothetical protein